MEVKSRGATSVQRPTDPPKMATKTGSFIRFSRFEYCVSLTQSVRSRLTGKKTKATETSQMPKTTGRLAQADPVASLPWSPISPRVIRAIIWPYQVPLTLCRWKKIFGFPLNLPDLNFFDFTVCRMINRRLLLAVIFCTFARNFGLIR